MTISELIHRKYDDIVDCTMCDNSRNVFELMKRIEKNKMPLCLPHLEKMAPLYTITDLQIMKGSIIKKFVNKYAVLRFLCGAGFFEEDIC